MPRPSTTKCLGEVAIAEALYANEYNLSRAARALGVSVRALRRALRTWAADAAPAAVKVGRPKGRTQ